MLDCWGRFYGYQNATTNDLMSYSGQLYAYSCYDLALDSSE